MAKDLPFFKFEPAEWENGNIQMCSRASKGLFVDLCAMYWARLGNMSYALALQKHCNGDAAHLQELINARVIVVDDAQKIVIEFLDEQLLGVAKISEKRRLAANKRWYDASALQKDMQNDAILDIDIDIDNKKECVYIFAHLSMTVDEHARLIEKGYTKSQIEDVVEQIKNYSKNNRYKSLYTTTLNWLKKRYDNSEPDYSINKKHLMEIADAKQEHGQWISDTYTYHRIKEGQLGFMAARFVEYLTSKAEAPAKMSEFKRYFSSWLGWDSTRKKFSDRYLS